MVEKISLELGTLPLYQQIKNKLIMQINSGEFKPNTLIPSERELVDLYDVSRITIRKAIDLLVQEDYLYKMPGKGTYVKEKVQIENLVALKSLTQMLKDMGLNPIVRTISADIQIPSNFIKNTLHLLPKEQVYLTKRLIEVDNIPVCFTKSYLVYKYVAGIEKYNLNKRSLYNVLRKEYGFDILGAHHSVEAGMVEGEIAEYLQIDSHTPLVKFDGQVYARTNSNTILFEYVKTYYRCDRFKFYINGV